MTKSPWCDRAFGSLYPILYAHRDGDSATDEVAFVRKMLELSPLHQVIDLGCGSGRHLRALQTMGISAIGLDRSNALLAIAQKASLANLLRGDLRRLPLQSQAFDAALSFFTSFGYFEDEVDDARVLSEVSRILKPGGKYLLDYLLVEDVLTNLNPFTTKTVKGYELEEARRVERNRVFKKVTIRHAEWSEPYTYEESVRLLQPQQLEVMLASAGLKTIGRYGDLSGSPLGSGTRCVLVAEKRA
jgi:ubiquinone/menaquinone biosynthesis C-methylase UbiE